MIKNINFAKRYGENFGLIFQATDDLLDSIGSKRILGKNIKKDIMQNKGSILLFKNKSEVKKYCKILASQATKKSVIFGKDNYIFKELIFSIIDRTV